MNNLEKQFKKVQSATMKKYDIMLEYDVHVNVEVEAGSEEEAFARASEKASNLSPEEFVSCADISLNPDYYEAQEIND